MTSRFHGRATANASTALLIVWLTACGNPEETASPEATHEDTVATWSEGVVSFADLETTVAEARTPACMAARRGTEGGSVEALVPCYREAAEGVVLERLILAELPDVGNSLQELGEGEGYRDLRHHAYLEEHLRHLQDTIEVSEVEVAAHFEDNRERFQGAGHLTLWNIFRRHQDAAQPEATMTFLNKLKERFAAGETFEQLAREHSHSETRLRGGLVGRLGTGRLPERLGKIASALAPGEVSEPVPVHGGAVLLHVTEVVQATDVSLDDVRPRVRRQLESQRIQEAIAARVADLNPPQDALVLAPEALITALDDKDGQRVVMRITESLTVDQMRRLAGFKISQRAENLDEEGRQRLMRIYRQQQETQLLVIDLLARAEPELREVAEEHLREEAIDAIVDEKIRLEIDQMIDADSERLRQYFTDNRLHYQSPLRFLLHIWTLPFDIDPPAQLKKMEELRERLALGQISLAAAAAELGGSVNSLGWTDFEQLRGLLPGKAQSFVLQLGASGYSIAYQQAKALHVIWLEERQEPRQLEYEKAAEQVREDYVTRFEQDFFRQVSADRLAGAGFVFDEEAVRRLLTWPGSP